MRGKFGRWKLCESRQWLVARDTSWKQVLRDLFQWHVKSGTYLLTYLLTNFRDNTSPFSCFGISRQLLNPDPFPWNSLCPYFTDIKLTLKLRVQHPYPLNSMNLLYWNTYKTLFQPYLISFIAQLKLTPYFKLPYHVKISFSHLLTLSAFVIQRNTNNTNYTNWIQASVEQ